MTLRGRLKTGPSYELEADEKAEGKLPVLAGSPLVGLQNHFGWSLQGFIEDAQGRLRLQTHEEHLACMGCHTNLGVTLDQTFAFARKAPSRAGWAYQGLPSRERALELNRAYMVLAGEQRFDRGRDVALAPAQNVHASIQNQATGLVESKRVYVDGQLRLAWGPAEPQPVASRQ